MSDLGFGLSPFGTSIFGYGTTTSLNSSTAKLFLKSDGSRGNVAKIDAVTGDFVLDEFGNKVGDDSVNQMMYLALRTSKNSSALLNFGIDLSSIKTITDGVNLKITLFINDAVKHLTDKNLVSIENVIIERTKDTGLAINVKWKNLTSNELNTFKF